MQITREIVMELNNELAVKGCPFRYKFIDDGLVNSSIEITLPSMRCVESFIINPKREFFDWLKLWFKTIHGIEINCNNDGSILWSNDFSLGY